MTSSLALNNILLWSFQIGLLVAVAALLPVLLRLKMPNAKLAFWHLALLACLLLPAMRSWKPDVIGDTITVSSAIVAVVPGPRAATFSLPPMGSLLLLLAAGVLVGIAFLSAGFWRLRRYRRQSHPLHPPSPWGAEADLRISGDVTSPVTFGFLKPVILLPARFVDLAEPLREAILCHEVLHVRRNDWLFTVSEEFIRAVFWFHPAIWWLLGEIQLVREQAVDREVVEMTRSRDEYVDALLVIAGAPIQLDLAPAPLFLRKRHLKQRVVSILKEVKMSKAKSISALAAGVFALAVSCWFVTGALPLQAAPQVVADASGVVVETNGAQLMHRTSVAYPREAIVKGVQGTVIVQVKLDSAGNVSDASILSGPDELRKSVLQSVLGWHFTPEAALSTRQIGIAFELPKGSQPGGAGVPVVVRQVGISAPITQPMILKNITVAGLPDRQRDDLLARLPVHTGDAINPATARDVAQSVQTFDEHLRFMFSPDGTLSISTPESPLRTSMPAPPLPGAAGVQIQANYQAVRILAEVQQANLVSQVRPAYPALAKQARVQGTVTLETTIGKDGTVQNLHLVSGPPLLVQAAMEAVRQWVYKPTMLNGNPVDVITTIDVNFTLSQ